MMLVYCPTRRTYSSNKKYENLILEMLVRNFVNPYHNLDRLQMAFGEIIIVVRVPQRQEVAGLKRSSAGA